MFEWVLRYKGLKVVSNYEIYSGVILRLSI